MITVVYGPDLVNISYLNLVAFQEDVAKVIYIHLCHTKLTFLKCCFEMWIKEIKVEIVMKCAIIGGGCVCYSAKFMSLICVLIFRTLLVQPK